MPVAAIGADGGRGVGGGEELGDLGADALARQGGRGPPAAAAQAARPSGSSPPAGSPYQAWMRKKRRMRR